MSPAVHNDSTPQLKTASTTADDYLVNTITVADIVNVFAAEDIDSFKVDIEGRDEIIPRPLLDLCSHHKIPCLISFHTPWWQRKDLSDIEEVFKHTRIQSDALDDLEDPRKYLKQHPFGSLFVTFPPKR
jgi:hypothetical protein